MATDLAKLVVSLEAETAKYTRELEKAQKKLDSFSKRAQAEATAAGVVIGQFAVDAARSIATFAKQTIDAADNIAKVSQSTGMAAESISQLGYAADLSGVSQDELSTALVKLNKAAVEAAEGGKTQAQAFESLGVKVRDAAGKIKPTEQLLTEVAQAFSELKDGPGKSALAMDIFGKSGAKLIPLLNNGRQGLADLRAEAVQFGQSISGEAAAAAEQFNDNLARLQRAAQGVVITMTGELLPTLAAVTEAAVDAAKETGAGGGLVAGLRVAFETIVVLGANVRYVLEGIGREIGGIAAQAAAVATLDFGQAAEIGRAMREDAAAARAEIDGFSDRVLSAHANAEKVRGTMAKWGDAIKSARSGDLAQQQQVMQGLAAAYQAGEFGAIGTKAATEAYQRAVDQALPSVKKKTVAVRENADATRKAADDLGRMLEAVQLEAATLGMSAAQVELHRLRLAGASSGQLAFAASVKEAVEQFDKQKQALADGKSLTEAVRTPTESYAAEVERLGDLLARGAISQETFNRGVIGAQNALVAADPAMQKAIQRAKELDDLIASTPTGQLEKQQALMLDLALAYEKGRFGAAGSAEAQQRYAEAAQTALGTLPGTVEESTGLMQELTAEAARNMQGALADFFFDPLSGEFDDMADGFANALRRMVAEAAAAELMQALGFGKAGSSGGFDSLLGTVATAAAGAFAGTQAPAPVSEASFTPIPGRANGGDMRANRPYWTGEVGPELVFPGTTSRILSARDSQEFMRGGSRQVNQVFNIVAPDPNAFRASERQIVRKARQGMSA